MSVMNGKLQIPYHEEGPLSQTRTVDNSPFVVLYCHLLAQLCNLLCRDQIKLSRDNDKTTFVMSRSQEN